MTEAGSSPVSEGGSKFGEQDDGKSWKMQDLVRLPGNSVNRLASSTPPDKHGGGSFRRLGRLRPFRPAAGHHQLPADTAAGVTTQVVSPDTSVLALYPTGTDNRFDFRADWTTGSLFDDSGT